MSVYCTISYHHIIIVRVLHMRVYVQPNSFSFSFLGKPRRHLPPVFSLGKRSQPRPGKIPGNHLSLPPIPSPTPLSPGHTESATPPQATMTISIPPSLRTALRAFKPYPARLTPTFRARRAFASAPGSGSGEMEVGELEGGSFRIEPLRREGEDAGTMRARLLCGFALPWWRWRWRGGRWGGERRLT